MTPRQNNTRRSPQTLTVRLLPVGLSDASANWQVLPAPTMDAATETAIASVMFNGYSKARIMDGQKFRAVYRSGVDYTAPKP